MDTQRALFLYFLGLRVEGPFTFADIGASYPRVEVYGIVTIKDGVVVDHDLEIPSTKAYFAVGIFPAKDITPPYPIITDLGDQYWDVPSVYTTDKDLLGRRLPRTASKFANLRRPILTVTDKRWITQMATAYCRDLGSEGGRRV